MASIGQKRHQKKIDNQYYYLATDEEDYIEINKRVKKQLDRMTIILVGVIVAFVIFLVIRKAWEDLLNIAVMILTLFLAVRLSLVEQFKKFVKDDFLRIGVFMAVLLPITFSWLSGYQKGKSIFQNKGISIVKFHKNQEDYLSRMDTTKFIGYIGDNIIVSTVDNKILRIINKSSYESISLTTYIDNLKK